MGYPLLSENVEVKITSKTVLTRNDRAAEDMLNRDKTLPPTAKFEERCYCHRFDGEGKAIVYNPDINAGVEICFDSALPDALTERKMMSVRDYVLGLEPDNSTPDGRDVLRKNGTLSFTEPGEEKTFSVKIELFEK